MKRRVCKIIDYCFQHRHQLISAYDDSNSMRYLSDKFDITVFGRLNISKPEWIMVEDYKVCFLPAKMNSSEFCNYMLNMIRPDVVHMHGNHSWRHYQQYAPLFRKEVKKMIFSPAGSSCGTPEFLSNFDHIIVNHPLQIYRMKTPDKHKIIVRKRSADPTIFYPVNTYIKKYDFVYIAGFVPTKQIDVMIETVINTDKTLCILGDFTRTDGHYRYIKKLIENRNLKDKIFLHDFIEQTSLSSFLGQCGVFVWPNIKPENPSTTTNRSVIEGLACGMPLLLGRRAFNETEFVVEGKNGFLYDDFEDFNSKSNIIFNDLDKFRNESIKLNQEEFSFQDNFINFYKGLY